VFPWKLALVLIPKAEVAEILPSMLATGMARSSMGQTLVSEEQWRSLLVMLLKAQGGISTYRPANLPEEMAVMSIYPQGVVTKVQAGSSPSPLLLPLAATAVMLYLSPVMLLAGQAVLLFALV
jgi:hypothetical protein